MMIKIDGEKIKQLRERQGLTQLYMATAVEVTTDTISRWENKRYPTIKEENGQKLAEALGVSLQEILLDDPEPEPAPAAEENDGTSSDPVTESAPPLHSEKPRKNFSFLIASVILFLIAAAVYVFLPSPFLAKINAVRTMPIRTIPGSPFPVVVEITTSVDTPLSVILKESLPPGTEIIDIAPDNGVSSGNRQIKWLKKIGNSERFSYLIKINEPAENDYLISGTVSTSGDSNSIDVAGAGSIRLGQFHWADSNGDNQISDQEILTVFDYYSGIDGFTIDIEFIEKMWLGSSYHWDSKNNLISITP